MGNRVLIMGYALLFACLPVFLHGNWGGGRRAICPFSNCFFLFVFTWCLGKRLESWIERKANDNAPANDGVAELRL